MRNNSGLYSKGHCSWLKLGNKSINYWDWRWARAREEYSTYYLRLDCNGRKNGEIEELIYWRIDVWLDGWLDIGKRKNKNDGLTRELTNNNCVDKCFFPKNPSILYAAYMIKISRMNHPVLGLSLIVYFFLPKGQKDTRTKGHKRTQKNTRTQGEIKRTKGH